jgi:CRP-like cAMP-binding protein
MIESKFLKENIENIQRLMSISALKHFETRNLGKLLRLSKIRQYDPGEAIIHEGDRDTWLYFLLSGEVRISKEGEEISTIGRRGDIFGEMRIIDDRSRSATVTAIDKVVALAVDTSARSRMSTADGKDERLESIAVEFNDVINRMRRVVDGMQMGIITDLTVRMERVVVSGITLNEDYMVLLILAPNCDVKRASAMLGLIAPRIIAEM